MQNKSKSLVLVCSRTGRKQSITPAFAAQLTGRSVRTAQRWAAGSSIDVASQRLLELLCLGELGCLSADWAGWKLDGEYLIEDGSHHRYWWTPDRLRTWWIDVQELDYYRSLVRRARGRDMGRVETVTAGELPNPER